MLPFTVVQCQLPLSTVGLIATLVPLGLTVILFAVILPIAETRVSLQPTIGAIIGFIGWVLPCVLTSCTHSLDTCGTDSKFGSE